MNKMLVAAVVAAVLGGCSEDPNKALCRAAEAEMEAESKTARAISKAEPFDYAAYNASVDRSNAALARREAARPAHERGRMIMNIGHAVCEW